MQKLNRYGMKKVMSVAVLALCVVFGRNNAYAVTTYSSNATITSSNTAGIKETFSCTLTFSNTSDITIGSSSGSTPGIEIAAGITLTINNTSSKKVTIYGGTSSDSNATYHYAGIY